MRHRHPECRGRHECLPLPQTSGVWVDRARSFAASLRTKGKVLTYAAARVATTPFYDDCWDNRGRCQGMRPCREPVDHMHTCRATAMFCRGAGADGWASELTKAKAWIPSGRPTASLLYMFDGQAEALQTETFRTWGPASVGYGAHALVFGPQFGKFHGHAEWKHKLAVVRGALRRARNKFILKAQFLENNCSLDIPDWVTMVDQDDSDDGLAVRRVIADVIEQS